MGHPESTSKYSASCFLGIEVPFSSSSKTQLSVLALSVFNHDLAINEATRKPLFDSSRPGNTLYFPTMTLKHLGGSMWNHHCPSLLLFQWNGPTVYSLMKPVVWSVIPPSPSSLSAHHHPRPVCSTSLKYRPCFYSLPPPKAEPRAAPPLSWLRPSLTANVFF